ncbi:MAG: hypothetical protein ACRD0G_12515 [Acidimicrobiales bacterium]
MFKRATWFTIGVGVGLAGRAWVNRRVRETVERYKPAGAVRKLGGDVRAAVVGGRDAMRARERALRADIYGPSQN